MQKTTAPHVRPRPRPWLARRAAAVLAGTAALVGLAGALPADAAQTTQTTQTTQTVPAVGRTAPGPTAAPRPPADFSDCPSLPAGADPARWSCEVHSAAPRLTMGGVTVTLAPITMTHAEGPLPDGSPGQVWGAMHSAATPVPGGLTGIPQAGDAGLLRLAIRPEYGGRSDFYTGRLSLRFRLVGPLLPHGCLIGTDAPVDFALKRSGPSVWVSTQPPLIEFSAYDDTFTAPAAKGCGPLTGALNRRLGLPAASGNLMSYDAAYTFRTYDELPTR
ncbi:hypothetical protein ABZ858_06065 [Streptomyces sp. NPDC047017]|uniref:hypothetical protein n=1 Tax=Streptomyces sp. NPDC047017 TaxID=3155024 RepID=UPI0033D4AE29